MPNDTFWTGLIEVLKSLPPALAGLVLVIMALAVLGYSWRKATEEAKREKTRAETSVAALDAHKLDAILQIVSASAEKIGEIHTTTEVLKDRRGR